VNGSEGRMAILNLCRGSWRLMIVALLMALFLSGCFLFGGTSSDPKKVFKEFIADPIPKGIKLKKGMVTGWQGYYAYVIFTAEPQVFKELVRDYEFLPDCRRKETVQSGAKTEETYFDVRTGLGKPVAEAVASMPTAKCYYRVNSGEEGIRGIFHMIYDEETHRAVFEGKF